MRNFNFDFENLENELDFELFFLNLEIVFTTLLVLTSILHLYMLL